MILVNNWKQFLWQYSLPLFSDLSNKQYTHLSAYHFLHADVSGSVTRNPIELKPRYDFSECGKSDGTLPLVFSGQSIKYGEYPWLVAIFVTNIIATFKFVCAGNLVSQRHVITGKYVNLFVVSTLTEMFTLIVLTHLHKSNYVSSCLYMPKWMWRLFLTSRKNIRTQNVPLL